MQTLVVYATEEVHMNKPKVPVIFRYSVRENDLFAVLPTLPAAEGCSVMYSHVGQHSEGTDAYWRKSRPATRVEFADLYRELCGVYGDCTLVLRSRDCAAYRKERWAP